MGIAARHSARSVAVATTLLVWIAGLAVLAPHPVYMLMAAPMLAAVLGGYAIAFRVAKLPFARPAARGPIAGVAAAILCNGVALWCVDLWQRDPLAIALTLLCVTILLYRERDGGTGRSARVAAPSAIAVVAIGGGRLLDYLLANEWMWSATGRTQLLVPTVLMGVVLPLGWSFALCHVLAHKWRGFLAPGWRGILTRAVPGAALVLLPAFIATMTRTREGPPLPMLLHSAYAAAAAFMLYVRRRSSPVYA